ncbi:sushi domain-containing protein 1-like [Sinocyclocheilus anshuiensis]|uniref:sushi domain-containing protein 1-like n=1 Tax=Sinocyclocheilus anshuiensis TaxID=1608454 RepID=UPI0007B88474|nr:PREDICTED: sushi domain-containing protein 1-like [Sinocyclocheilus anshuiensis]
MRHMYLLSLGLLALTENILMQTPCGHGYKNQRRKCVDENECEYEAPICGKNAKCFNTIGSYYCRCHEGFTPTNNFTQADAIDCTDINECANGSADCGPNAKCINSEGGYNCTRQTGYISSNGKEIFNSGHYFSLDIFGPSICLQPNVSGSTNYGHKRTKYTGQSSLNKCFSASFASRTRSDIGHQVVAKH